jgi:hypothetical protein
MLSTGSRLALLFRRYAAPVRDAKPPATIPASFTTPFAGHLPGYLAASQATAPGRPNEHVYNELLMAQWRALLDSPASRDERLLRTFLERHPSLVPGSATVDGDSGHAAYPLGVITRPKLPGLSDREPDPIDRRDSDRMIKRRGARSGLSQRAHMHSLCHSLAVALLRAGVPVRGRSQRVRVCTRNR